MRNTGFQLQDTLKDHGNVGIPPTVGSLFKGAGFWGEEGKLDTLIFVCCAFFLIDMLKEGEGSNCTRGKGEGKKEKKKKNRAHTLPSPALFLCVYQGRTRGVGGTTKSVVLTGPICASTSSHIHKQPRHLGSYFSF